MTDHNPPPTSRNIPQQIQREIRQRCGFGCVVCGLPLYEYDHLLGWAKVHRHVAAEITLLCDQHHRERGSGLLPLSAVETANRNPYNLRAGTSKPYDLHFTGNECEVTIGGNSFSASDGGYGTKLLPVSVDGTPLLEFVLGDGHLMLSLNIFDEFNRLILQIQNNQLVQSANPWDIRFVGQNLVVREAVRRILVDITFLPPNQIKIQRGRFLRNGVEILIHPNRIVIANNGAEFSGNCTSGLPGGILVGPHDSPVPAIIAMPNVTRYGHDPKKADEWIAGEFDEEKPAS